MKNRYEFKAEDIRFVRIIAESDPLKYTIDYSRIYESGRPTRHFISTYSAKPDIKGDKVFVICNHCDRWNVVDRKEYDQINASGKEFSMKCKYCNNEEEDIIDEGKLITSILALMDKDTFFDTKLYINSIEIK